MALSESISILTSLIMATWSVICFIMGMVVYKWLTKIKS